MPATNEALLTISEASAIMGVSEVTLRQWTDEGKIKAFITPGGHRRYSRRELNNLMSSNRKPIGVKDLIAEIEATSDLHREIGRTFLITKDWHSQLNKEGKSALAQLGRNMIDVIIRYLNEPAKREQTLEYARDVGQGFGETLAGLGLPLTDSVEAFNLHRDPIMKAISHLLKKREAHTSRVAGAIPLMAQVMDVALLSLVTTHQRHNSSTLIEKGDKSL